MIPAATEEFFPESDGSSWVGPAPRLKTADGFTAYAKLFPTAVFGYPGIRLAPASLSVPAFDVTVQLSSPGAVFYHELYIERWSEAGSFLGGLAYPSVTVDIPPGEWVTHTFHLVAGVDYDQATVEASIAAGTFCVLGFADVDYTGAAEELYYSQIGVSVGETYLRNFARDDGLGANPPRNFGGTSRQGSLRNFGYR